MVLKKRRKSTKIKTTDFRAERFTEKKNKNVCEKQYTENREKDLKTEFEQLRKKEALRETLSKIRSEIKEPEKREEARKEADVAELLIGLLSEEDAKTRKNAALLIGDLQLEEAKAALLAAYQKEKTLFVKSAYLTALCELHIEEYGDFFRERLEELKALPAVEEEMKHRNEEIRELTKILQKTEGVKKHPFRGFTAPHEMLLLTNREQREVTLSEVKEIGASVQRRVELHPLGVKIFSKEVLPFAKLRTYRELLFQIHTESRLNDRADAAAKLLWESDPYKVLTECHKGDAPFYFRLEVKGRENRTEFVKKLGIALEKVSGWKLMNSTTDYEVEIRLIETKDGGFVPFLKLYTIPVKRFSYRKHAVAASIHPANAAMLVYLAKPYLKEDAQILDPCCGVGTMLIERDICVPAREKYGIDIFGDAIEMARENAAAAGERINFIHKDYLDFKHAYKFDEIITNLPDRGKKSREEMDAFYAAFFEKSKEILADEAVLILYSNEIGFVKKQLRLHREYRLIQEFAIQKKTGDTLFVIGYRR